MYVPGMKVVGYVWNGARLPRNQEATIQRETARRNWHLVHLFSDSPVDQRTGLEKALASLRIGDGQTLVVSHLGALARSSKEFTRVVARVARIGGRLIVLDPPFDTRSSSGRLLVEVAQGLTQLDAAAQRMESQAQTEPKSRGRTPMKPEVRSRIWRYRDQSWSLDRIARRLNEDGVPTSQGGKKWYASTVKGVVDSRL
jgi:DNA invertase Pin-like site-specific DNA recombinase